MVSECSPPSDSRNTAGRGSRTHVPLHGEMDTAVDTAHAPLANHFASASGIRSVATTRVSDKHRPAKPMVTERVKRASASATDKTIKTLVTCRSRPRVQLSVA